MKTMIRRFLAVGLLVTGPVHVSSAITISAGQSVLFNFDLTGVSPSPPFEDVTISTNITNLGIGDRAVGICYDGVDGTGTALVGVCSSTGSIVVAGRSNFGDGLFSWSVRAVTGRFDVAPCATGRLTGPGAVTECVAGTVSSVPEPGALALLGLGLAGLGRSRRRKG